MMRNKTTLKWIVFLLFIQVVRHKTTNFTLSSKSKDLKKLGLLPGLNLKLHGSDIKEVNKVNNTKASETTCNK